MERHIHLHCIATGGGLSLDGQKWVKPKSNHYLLNVVELSAAYRDKLLSGIERLVKRQEIVLADEADGAALAQVLVELRAKKWEVFIKPFAGPEVVTDYLSRYVHQVAISNYRLESIDKGLVRFRYFALRRTRRGVITGNGLRWVKRAKRRY